MKIKMRQTALGSPDGVQVNTYEAGETYELGESLAQCFLGDGVAGLAGKPEPKSKPAKRAKGGPAENKDAGAAPENKTE